MSADLGTKLDKIAAKYPDKVPFNFRRGSKWDNISYMKLFENSNQLESGSTGLPKGAVYSQANFAAQFAMLTDTFHISLDEIDLPAFPVPMVKHLYLS